MNKPYEEMDEKELLQALIQEQKINARNNRIAMITIIVLAAAMLLCLAVMLPNILHTMQSAKTAFTEGETVLSEAHAILEQAKTSLEGVDTMVGNVNSFVEENTDAVSEVVKKVNAVDFDKLSRSIEDLNAVIAPLAKLFGRG